MALPLIPLGLFLVIVALLLVWAANKELFVPLVESLSDSWAGRILRRAIPIVAVLDAIRAANERLLDPLVARATEWLDALQMSIRSWAADVADFAAALAVDVRYLTTVHLPDAIGARVAPVRALATDALDRARSLDAELGRFRDRVLGVELPSLARGIDRLRDRLLEVELPRFARGIDRLERDAAALRARVTDVAGDLAGIRTADLPRIRVDVDAGRRLLDEVRTWTLPISAVFAGAAVVELLRHVRRCEPKTERLCRLDLDDWEDMLGLVVSFATIAAMVEVMRGVARGSDELVDGLRLLR